MNRKLTNVLRFILDELLPPILRDNKYFLYPLFYIWYKGKYVRERMEFKSHFHELDNKKYMDLYMISDSLSHDRPTDLNQQSIDFIIESIGEDKSQKIMDVGCGRGYFLNLLAQKGYNNLHGCDLFDSLDLESASYTYADIEKLPFEDNSFDIVCCSHTLEHVMELRTAIEELKRIASKKLIITVPCQRYYHYTFDLHIHFFPEKSYLLDAVKVKNYVCKNRGGDWVLVADMQGS